MKPKTIYLLLCVVGAALPYSQLVPWLLEHGLDLRLFFAELFANRIGAFFGLDVIASAVVLFVLVASEGRRFRVRHRWAPVVATLVVGVSLGLPLFLYFRESRLERSA
jgi:Terpene cyclase DEP1